MSCITHPLIKPDSIEAREYQLSVAMRALEGNTLLVLPTGLGKTAVALLVAASRLHNFGGKVLMLAPTKPLVEQHLRFFEKFMNLPEAEDARSPALVMFTGESPHEKREDLWEQATMVFATPQVIKNDLIAWRYTLSDVSLLVVDECHRAVGDYAYVFLADRYLTTAARPLLLGMTASPGGDAEKVNDVAQTLGIEIFETRTEQDPDVRPYVHEREIDVVPVALPRELKEAIADISELMDSRLSFLADMNLPVPKRDQLSMKAMNAINAQIQQRIALRDPAGYTAASVYAELMKLKHAVMLAESQGSEVLKLYVTRLLQEGSGAGGSKAAKRLAQDPIFLRLLDRCMGWTGELHPKRDEVLALVRTQLEEHPESKVIVFATYRDTVQQLATFLTENGVPAERFVGQATRDSEKGLSQKKQIAALDRFRAGEFRVLIATSVGEEGLDVPATDMVIFYEPVPSEIRSIQRKGRTGRHGAGKIIVLVTRGTTDEAFRYVSQNREKMMQKGLRNLSSPRPAMGSPGNGGHESTDESEPGNGVKEPGMSGESQATIGEFSSGPRITVDDRETSSKVVERLSTFGADITLKRLEKGDYSIGDRILVERKTVRDFVDTLVDRDLLGQMKEMADAAQRPVLVIEGTDDIFAVRSIHPNAIRGAIAAIAIDLGVTVLYTGDAEGTAQMLFLLAKREDGGDRGDRKVHPHKSYRSEKEEIEYVISSLPGVGMRTARLLLGHFGSIRAIANASEDEIRAVKGVGGKTARRIAEIVGKDYR
ncbi:MAG: DEAD/DEAH box helicase [Methanoregulaceae archaeon]